ncbi:NAD-dependent epimerase/dehydratase family protein [Nonomuraea fuscirosea]|uniref:NAD-dependent epimerase/dehydratase family protein n=1 Tax=Nonomuraea fuscirosea TaxID=1291556 RepID=UPI00341DADCE
MKVLYIGGTGTISSSCVAESVRQGMDVHVLNRGRTAGVRPLPDGVTTVTGDVHDPESMRAALGGSSYDVVINFLSYGAEDAAAWVDLLAGRIGQYIHISTASMYHKPVRKVPFVESTTRHNPYSAYSQDKIAAEDVLRRAYEERGFPVTIVRPSHTYDDARPPLPGDWTAWDRIVRGDELVVPGDGTSLWTLTHAADFAVGLVGLAGNWPAIGEDFHITSDEVLTWNEIYDVIARTAGTEARLLHLPSEFLPIVAPDWFWSSLIVGDLSHSAVFDNSKIKRFVPAFRPVITWPAGARRLLEWRAGHAEHARPDAGTDALLGRLVEGHQAAVSAVRKLAP